MVKSKLFYIFTSIQLLAAPLAEAKTELFEDFIVAYCYHEVHCNSALETCQAFLETVKLAGDVCKIVTTNARSFEDEKIATTKSLDSGETIELNSIFDSDIVADLYLSLKGATITVAKNRDKISKCIDVNNDLVIRDPELLEGETFSKWAFIDEQYLSAQYILSKYLRAAGNEKLTKEGSVSSDGQRRLNLIGANLITEESCDLNLRQFHKTHAWCRFGQNGSEFANRLERPDSKENPLNSIARTSSLGNWVDSESTTELSKKNTNIDTVLRCYDESRVDTGYMRIQLLKAACQVGTTTSLPKDNLLLELSGSGGVKLARELLAAIQLDQRAQLIGVYNPGPKSAHEPGCRGSEAGFSDLGMIVATMSFSDELAALTQKRLETFTEYRNSLKQANSVNERFSYELYEAYAKKIKLYMEKEDAERLRKSRAKEKETDGVDNPK